LTVTIIRMEQLLLLTSSIELKQERHYNRIRIPRCPYCPHHEYSIKQLMVQTLETVDQIKQNTTDNPLSPGRHTG